MLSVPEPHLKLYSPGRGLGVEPLAKLPTRGKLFRKVAKGFKARVDGGDPYDVIEGDAADLEAAAELRARLLGSGRAVIKTPLVVRNESLLLNMIRSESSIASIVAFWTLAEGPAFATQALCRAWGVTFTGPTYERRVKVSNAVVTPCPDRTLDYRYLPAFVELRRCLGLVDEAAYAAGVAAAAACREGASLELRIALSFAYPTETEWSAADARDAMALEEVPESACLLFETLGDAALATALFESREFPYKRYRGSLLVVAWRNQEAAIPALIAVQRKHHELGEHGRFSCSWGALEALALMPTDEVLDYAIDVLDRNDNVQTKYIAPCFLNAPEKAFARLSKVVSEGGSRAALVAPHLDALLQQFPELNVAATPRASQAELPEVLRGAPDKVLVDFSACEDVFVAGGDKALAADAVQQLATLMRAAARARTPAIDAAIAALDVDSVRAFSHGLFDRWAGRPLAADKWIGRCQWLVGDDHTARRIGTSVKNWSGKYYTPGIACLEALVDIGSAAALVQVSLVASKGKSTGIRKEANQCLLSLAERQGLSAAQLADRLVPSFGLDAAGTMVLDYGPRSFRVGFDGQLKPYVVDGKGKRRAGLPRTGTRDDAAKATAARATFSALKKDVQALASAQIARLEQAMCISRGWSVADFDTYLRGHPLLLHVVRRLVWGCFSGSDLMASFRVDDTGAAVDVNGQPVVLQGVIGVAHPVRLAAELAAWQSCFRGHGIKSPVSQLDRAIFHPGDAVDALVAALNGRDSVEEGRVRGLLNEGWHRGPIEDNGLFHSMTVARLDVTARLELAPGLRVGRGGSGGPRVTCTLTGEGGVTYSEVVRQLSGLLG